MKYFNIAGALILIIFLSYAQHILSMQSIWLKNLQRLIKLKNIITTQRKKLTQQLHQLEPNPEYEKVLKDKMQRYANVYDKTNTVDLQSWKASDQLEALENEYTQIDNDPLLLILKI